jgi:ABC-type transport system substrate-binding protein
MSAERQQGMVSDFAGRGMTRRGLLRGSLAGGMGLAAAALIGCGSDDEEPSGGTGEGAPETSTGTQTAAGIGELIKDDALPYPYQFPEPDKPVKPGGVMVFGVNSDVSTFDPAKTTASGTGRVVNMVYNRLIGFNRGVRLHPFKLEFEPELARMGALAGRHGGDVPAAGGREVAQPATPRWPPLRGR